MKLYNVENETLSPISSKPFKLEKDIQELIESNVRGLFNLEFVKSELTIQNYRFDTLCFDVENKSFVIIEYKKGTNYSVIDQGYSYLSVMLNNKSDFILEYNETKNNTLRRDDIDWSQSRIIFISPNFTDYQKNSINFKDIPFELWEIKRYSNGIVGLDRHSTNSNESIETVSNTTGDSNIEKVSREVKVYNEEDHLNQSKVQETTKELYRELKDRILNLGDDIEIVPRKMYIAFKKESNFFDVNIAKDSLWCWINLKKGELDDPNNICRDVSNIGHYGNGDYDLSIDSDTDLDYVMFLIKQSFNKQIKS